MNFRDLEPLGVGLAADLAGQTPDFRQFVDARSPDERIKYLNFGAHHRQLARVCFFLRDLIDAGFPLVFHPLTLNPADEREEPRDVIDGNSLIMNVTRARWAGQDAAVWMWEGQYLGHFLMPMIFDEDSVRAVADKIRRLGEQIPCPFLLENPPVSFSIESMHLLDFMAQVSQQADCGLVLDVGHLLAYQQATGRAPSDMPLHRFPFDRVVEVHMAGLERSAWGPHVSLLDQHNAPITEVCWEFLRAHLPRMTNLKGLTLEQEFCDTELVRKHLRRAHALVRETGALS